MLRLHDSASSGNAYKVRLLLTQLGVPFERIEYDIDHGATRTSEFLSTKNANGRIPVLELEDGRCLPESNAIICYLAEGTRFLPADSSERWLRAQVLQWLFFEQYSHEPNIATCRYWLRHGLMSPARAPAFAQKRLAGYAALAVMENHLATRDFFAGVYSIADIALYAYTHVAAQGGFDLARFPSVTAWLARVRGQPGHVPLGAS
jgi:glutathione S-transferase